MAPQWPDLVLPCSPSQRCLDRFSILDDQEDEDGLVPFWPLLKEVLKQPVNDFTQLIDVLETISSTLRGSSVTAGDYGSLRSVVERHQGAFYSHTWPTIVRLALDLPEHIPQSLLPPLLPGNTVRLHENTIASLVANQFLCSLQCPSWRDGFHDFSVWYSSEQRHPKAVEMYLTALLSYFERFERTRQSKSKDGDVEHQVDFTLRAFNAGDILLREHLGSVPLSPIQIEDIESYSTEQQELGYQGPDGAVVVSANKDIGFGQSATQEELYVGNCPEACPAVLFTPTLQDDQVLVIEGARPMLRISGQRRDISWERLDEKQSHGGRMLFMDALEIDEADEGEILADLKLENVWREIKKAYVAFSSWGGKEKPDVIWAGLWGCGAFNGDPGVKVILMWIAASLAGKELRVLCDPSQEEFSVKFSRFVDTVPRLYTVKDLMGRLGAIPASVQRLRTIDWLLENGDAVADGRLFV